MVKSSSVEILRGRDHFPEWKAQVENYADYLGVKPLLDVGFQTLAPTNEQFDQDRKLRADIREDQHFKNAICGASCMRPSR